MRFGKFDVFLFDLDGTTWRFPDLIPGVRMIYDMLDKAGKQKLFVSNFTLLSRKGILKKLRSLGIEVELNQIISTGFVVKKYFENKKGKAFVLGNSLKEDLKGTKLKFTDKLPVDYLIVGHDETFDYIKLSKAIMAARQGAKIFSSAPGRIYPIKGTYRAGTGAIVAAIEYGSEKKSICLGKPCNFFMNIILRSVKAPANKVVMFGDELESDISIGNKLGYHTVLVRSGSDKKVVDWKPKPKSVINSLANIKL